MKNPPTKSKIVFVSTIPPTECGIATFTKDLITGINNSFGGSMKCVVCEITNNTEGSKNSAYKLDPENKKDYIRVAQEINEDPSVKLVHIQHEYGLFRGVHGDYLLYFLETLKKPIALTYHSIIQSPDNALRAFVRILSSYASTIFVMTEQSKRVLIDTYGINEKIVEYVPHGTHIVGYKNPKYAKEKFELQNRTVLSTFGLMGPGKNIETALYALSDVIEKIPDVIYLVIGKTHPNNIINNTDSYRSYLEELVEDLGLHAHVRFIDRYLEISELLGYLQATDLYLFTSNDPNQAVSGTFAYAMSCACPIVATSIPHTREILGSDVGRLVEIGNSALMAKSVLELLSDRQLLDWMAINAFQKTRESSWENVAIKHVTEYGKQPGIPAPILFDYPDIKLDHIKRMTTPLGIIQFSEISEPSITSGFTLDDNARALIAMCMHYEVSMDEGDLKYINIYLDFIERCQQPSGTFINYVEQFNRPHIKNNHINLEDSNARAIWALGKVVSLKRYLPDLVIKKARGCLLKSSEWIMGILSPRAIGFTVKGLYLYHSATKEDYIVPIIDKLVKNLVSNYDIHSLKDWRWFENYLTYANSIIPEAMLYAYLTTREPAYKRIALESFDFLLSKMFINGHFKVISNQGWYQKGVEPHPYGEQPIDVSYTIQALDIFYKTFKTPKYRDMMEIAFSWFLGKNHLNQTMYDPYTGGCYDGLEETHVNLNQGAESTVCYLIARMVMEQNRITESFGLEKEVKFKSKTIPLLLNAGKKDFKWA